MCKRASFNVECVVFQGNDLPFKWPSKKNNPNNQNNHFADDYNYLPFARILYPPFPLNILYFSIPF